MDLGHSLQITEEQETKSDLVKDEAVTQETTAVQGKSSEESKILDDEYMQIIAIIAGIYILVTIVIFVFCCCRYGCRRCKQDNKVDDE